MVKLGAYRYKKKKLKLREGTKMVKKETALFNEEQFRNNREVVIKNKRIMGKVIEDLVDYIESRGYSCDNFKVTCQPEGSRLGLQGRYYLGRDVKTKEQYAMGLGEDGTLTFFTTAAFIKNRVTLEKKETTYEFQLLDVLQTISGENYLGAFRTVDLRKTMINRFIGINTDKLICPVVDKDDLAGEFRGTEVTELDISRLNTSECRNFSGMLKEAEYIEEIRLGGLDMGNGVDLSELCYGCRNLKIVDFGWNEFDSVRDCSAMFEGCPNLKSVRMTHEAWMNLKKANGAKELFNYFNKHMNLTITT